jgi:branched-chain amino acid aminotransferase
MPVPVLSFDQIVDGLVSMRKPHLSNYFAMYSSWCGGIITDPALMTVPIDDHIVHRGDGIFEVFKCRNWNIYALDRHLHRLMLSMETFYLELPFGKDRLIEIIRATVRAGNHGTCLVRLFVSRGPGSFSASPYETIGTQLYVVVVAQTSIAPEKYEKGVKLLTSAIPIKLDYFATMKNCNYLPNVLMKKEAADRGADFSVSMDEKGFLAEGSTENIGIVTKKGELLIPRFSHTLRGITVTRAMELSGRLTGGELTMASEADITPEQAYDAAEILVFGTFLNILPVVEYDGKKIGNGRPGPVFRRLSQLLAEDESNNPEMLTPV